MTNWPTAGYTPDGGGGAGARSGAQPTATPTGAENWATAGVSGYAAARTIVPARMLIVIQFRRLGRRQPSRSSAPAYSSMSRASGIALCTDQATRPSRSTTNVDRREQPQSAVEDAVRRGHRAVRPEVGEQRERRCPSASANARSVNIGSQETASSSTSVPLELRPRVPQRGQLAAADPAEREG